MALKQAVRWEYIASNPAALVERPRVVAVEHRWWTPEQARRFLAATVDDDNQPLWRLALASCLRQSELLALRWQDVDVAGHRVHVRRTWSRSGIKGAPWVIEEPKGKRQRVVVIDVDTVATLLRHRERQAFMRSRSTRWVDGDLVFPNRDGGMVPGETARRHFRAAIAATELPEIRFHALRHTGATMLLAGGVPPKVVSEMLGHASLATTEQIYLHVLDEMQDDAADVMGRLLGGT